MAGVPNAADPCRGFAGAAYQAGDAPSAVVHADRQHLDAIVVHQGRRVGARQHQGRRTVIRQHQHFPIRSTTDSTRDPLAVARGREAVRTLDRLAVAHHGGQALGQSIALRVRLQPQALRQTRRRQRLRRLGQVLEQQLAAGYRVRVALLLEL